MSEIQSVPTPEQIKSAPERRLVNTNAVLQKALQRLTTEQRSTIALRCDDLPVVQGTEEDFELVFSGLLHTILQQKENVVKLFLHISCTAEDFATNAPTELKQFSIQFNTNIAPGAEWLQQHEQQLARVAATLQKNGGLLLVNQLKNTGCIFSVSLPGKTL